jgi:hypothetical protein
MLCVPVRRACVWRWLWRWRWRFSHGQGEDARARRVVNVWRGSV